MRGPMKIYAAKQILILTLLLGGGFCVEAQEVIHQKGRVEVAVGGSSTFKKLEGKAISYNSKIRTGADGLAIVSFPEGSKLRVDPNSEIEIGQRESVPKSSGNKESTWSLKIQKGALTVDFKKWSDGETLLVKSKHFSVGVRGTEFLIAKEEDKEEGEEQWLVALNEGEVTVFNPESLDHENLRPGEGLVVEKGGLLTAAIAYSWIKNINWNLSKKIVDSGFHRPKVREKRRSEVKGLVKE